MNTIMQFMKRNYKIVLLVVAFSVALWSFMPKPKASDPEKDKLLLELLTFVIEKGHYHPAAIDDTFSKGVYKSYINGLDPSKRFFLQSDIDEFAQYETKIDDQILNRDLSFFELTYNRLQQRMDESRGIYKDILAKPFDFNVNEEFNVDYEKMPYEKDEAGLRNKWRKQLKLSVLSSVTDKMKIQEELKNPKAEESTDATAKAVADKTKKAVKNEKPKTFEEIEKESRENSLKSLDEYFTFIKELDRNDWFNIYLNAIVERFDPHTLYLAPDDKEKFDVSMSGKFEGIGARLQKKNDMVEISELISGGPAWKDRKLEQGDLIMKVGQGDSEPIDIVGMKLDDVVKKIKGPKGTVVNLTVKKVDGTIKVIPVTRDIVELEETYAKSSIVNKDGKLYGIIYLPKFYINFDNKDDRDAAKDVAIEVERLKKQGVEGIVMDLRDNGGGSLRTVVDIAGLFIDKGPVVQIKSAGNKKEILSDTDGKIQWDGPLVVMQNNFSASASEIFAAAIQDYKRGIIIGSKQSYGKGTVQNVIDLNQFVRGNSMGDLGALKTTTQKFYRINGGSTQLKGVESDVVMPDRYSYIEIGERDTDNAMPWDKIEMAPYKVWDKQQNFASAIANSKKRLAQSAQFKLIDENAKWVNKRKDENVFNLDYKIFKAELDKVDNEVKKYKPISQYKNHLEFKSLPYEVEAMAKDTSFATKRNRWHESLAKDAYVEEALNILNDLQAKPSSGGKIAIKEKKERLVVPVN